MIVLLRWATVRPRWLRRSRKCVTQPIAMSDYHQRNSALQSHKGFSCWRYARETTISKMMLTHSATINWYFDIAVWYIIACTQQTHCVLKAMLLVWQLICCAPGSAKCTPLYTPILIFRHNIIEKREALLMIGRWFSALRIYLRAAISSVSRATHDRKETLPMLLRSASPCFRRHYISHY